MFIVLISTITSLTVSIVWSRYFMKQLEKWMDYFFEEETKRVKAMVERSSNTRSNK